jgi:hypothetical protein
MIFLISAFCIARITGMSHQLPASQLLLDLRKKESLTPEAIAHACNPSYLGGRDLEECGLSLAQAKISQVTFSTN